MPITPRVLLVALLSAACGADPPASAGPAPQDSPPAQPPVPEDSLTAKPPVPQDSQDVGPSKAGAGVPSRAGAGAPELNARAGRPTAARRYIAVVNKSAEAPCPPSQHAGWTATPLFRSQATAQLLAKELLPRALERFCQYSWGAAKLPSAPPGFDPAAAVVRLDADLDVVMPQTTTAGYLGGDAALRAALAGSFRGAAGLLPSGVPDALAHSEVTGPAYVAVIDTVGFADGRATTADSDPGLHHGLAMGEIVGDARCPGGELGCRNRRLFVQAFSHAADGAQALPGGGPLGSIGSLAQAIGEAVVRWQRSPKLNGSPLILNMSVAWDPRFGHELTPPGAEAEHWQRLITPGDQVSAPVQAVHAALVYAACLDALSFAAAGNNAGAPCEEQGAMAPALWERYPAPDAAACQQIFGAAMPRRAGERAVPAAAPRLVYAVGGVLESGSPIPIARPGSTPPRVAVAFQAIAGAGAQQTDAWTGTSVATAVLSGIAAQIWSHQRGLSPAQVIAVLDSSGVDGPRAEMLQGSKFARVITGYAAFARLCALRGGTCANPYAPPTSTPMATTLAAAPAMLATATNSAAVPLACTVRATQCGASTADVIECGATGPTAMTAPSTPEPWLRPQPSIPLCPVCPVRGGRLTLSLNPNYGGTTQNIQDPTLTFRRNDGSYLSARLGAITVSAAGTEVDLAGYTVVVNGAAQPLSKALLGQTEAGTLAFSVVEVTGARSRLVSAVPVLD